MTSLGPLTARLLILLDEPEPLGDYHFTKALAGERDLVRFEYAADTDRSSDNVRRWNLPELRTMLITGPKALQDVTGIGPNSFHHKKSGGLSRLIGSVWSREEVIAIRAACRPSERELILPPRLHSVIASCHPSAALRGSPHLMPTVYQMIKRARNLSMMEEF
jgi:hypothetical protein